MNYKDLFFVKIRIFFGNLFRRFLLKIGCDWLLLKKERFVEYPWITSNIGSETGKKILDIGVGSSSFSLQLASLGHEVHAIDLEDSREKELKDFSTKIPSYHFLIADATKLLYGKAIFDCVLFVSSLEHILEPEKAIFEAERVLKKGGLLLITVPYGIKKKGRNLDFYLYNKKSVDRLFKERNFKIIKKDYFTQISGNWLKSSEKKAENTTSGLVVNSIICLCLIKTI